MEKKQHFEILQFTGHPISENTFLALQNQTTFHVWNNQDSWSGQFESYLAQLLSWLPQIIDPIKQPSWIHQYCHWEGQCCSTLIALTAQHVQLQSSCSPSNPYSYPTTDTDMQWKMSQSVQDAYMDLNHEDENVQSIVINMYCCLSTVTTKYLISTWQFPTLPGCNAIPITSPFSQHISSQLSSK